MVRFEDIHFDCIRYSGYKPCLYGNECAGCPHYERHDPEKPEWKPKIEPLDLGKLPCNPRILIIKTGALGDVLRTTTLPAPLKRRFPSAVITWVTAPEAVPLLAQDPEIDRLVSIGDFDPGSEVFDLLINLEKENDALLLAGHVIAGQKAGYAPTPWGTAAIFNMESRYALILGISDELKFYGNTKSYPQIITEMAGLEFRRDPYVLEMSEESLRKRTEILGRITRGDESEEPIVGLNTGCGAVFRTKQWTLEGWSELAETLNARFPGRVLLLGGKAERELNSRILETVPGVIATGTDNSLEQFFGIVDACSIVVTSDSLGMHIAIARRKRTVALFGSTSHTEIDLYDRGEKVITDFPCSPCYLKTCDKKPMCMEELSSETVCAAVMRQVDAIRNCKKHV